jgi:hypothetical protein
VDSYLNTWRRHARFDADAHRRTMLDAYPFAPDLLEIMLRRVPARGGFQNVRGALGFLAHLVRLTHADADLVTPAHANILDREVAVRLNDLDPGSDLITRAQGNLVELSGTVPFAAQIASTTLLYTLTGVDSRTHGATREELIRSVLRPGADINEFEQGLRAFERYAAYFHVQEGRYFFDREENADAKVEFRSLQVDDSPARDEETRAALEAADKDRLRWVLAPRRLPPGDRLGLYHGLGMRNQVILLEPKDETLNLEGHPDLLTPPAPMPGAGPIPAPGRPERYEELTMLFDYATVARRAGIPEAQLERLCALVRAEFPSDEMMAELHILRALLAIERGDTTLEEVLGQPTAR